MGFINVWFVILIFYNYRRFTTSNLCVLSVRMLYNAGTRSRWGVVCDVTFCDVINTTIQPDDVLWKRVHPFIVTRTPVLFTTSDHVAIFQED